MKDINRLFLIWKRDGNRHLPQDAVCKPHMKLAFLRSVPPNTDASTWQAFVEWFDAFGKSKSVRRVYEAVCLFYRVSLNSLDVFPPRCFGCKLIFTGWIHWPRRQLGKLLFLHCAGSSQRRKWTWAMVLFAQKKNIWWCAQSYKTFSR